jgi:molybdopterin-binding protein
MNLVELIGISKNYDGKEVLKDVNLEIKKGMNLGLIGPTGCGKTTLIRIIDFLEEPSSGKFIFDSIDTNTCSKKEKMEIRRRIGMVFQKPVVLRGTVFENVAYGLDLRGLNKNNLKDKISSTLESLGLGGYEERNASSLSGGETQRLALARALITEPDLLLLDEPTANLDPISTEKIESIISKLRKNKQTTIIMATHDLAQGQRLSDEIAILNQHIFQIDLPEVVFRKPSSKFVADFVGVKNVIKGLAERTSEDLTTIKNGAITIFSSDPMLGEVNVSIRPEDITLSLDKVQTSALNELKGNVTEIVDNGTLINIKINVSGELFTVYMTRKSFLDMNLTIGSELWLHFKASAVHVFQ